MNPPFYELFPGILLAHLLGDFLFQSDEDAKNKHRFPVLLKHATIITLLAYVITGAWQLWHVPLLVWLSHYTIDAIKTRCKTHGFYPFIMDQAAHVFCYAVIASIPIGHDTCYWSAFFPHSLMLIKLLSGLLATTLAAGYGIGLFMQSLNYPSANDEGLPNGGALIGKLERGLIFLLVLSGELGGIGFLIAAKSILRFGQLNQKADRKTSEYIIIGTLLSFGAGLAISQLTLQWL